MKMTVSLVPGNGASVETLPCPLCGERKTFRCTVSEAEALIGGNTLIQDVFPTMSADDRERFISGICPPCWNKVFTKEDGYE